MTQTLSQLITRVQERISMSAGITVQLYAEDRIAEMIQHKFDTLFDKRFWPQFSAWTTVALDGTLGVSTTNLSTLIKRFEDIGVIYRADTDHKLTVLTPFTNNPNKYTGTSPVVYEGYSDAEKVFRIWPRASTGSLDIFYRTKPDTFISTDTVDFDDQVLILGAAWDYLKDDGTNINATEDMKGMYDDRVNQIENNLDRQPIPLDVYARHHESFTFVPL